MAPDKTNSDPCPPTQHHSLETNAYFTHYVGVTCFIAYGFMFDKIKSKRGQKSLVSADLKLLNEFWTTWIQS